MLGNIFPPFTTMQECNLDWILTKVKNILRFVPDDGQVGQILRRTRSGAEWSDEQGGGGAVNSVNGQTGTVVLTAADVGALPDSTTIPTNTSDLNNDSGFITAAQAPVQSVNGQTGSVTISVPTKTSDLNNDSGFVDAAGAAAAAPVQSVNGQTGSVTLSIPTKTSDLNNDSGFITSGQAPVQSVNGQIGTVTIGNFSSTEINTHEKWIDNKDIYRKVIRSAFNAGTTDVATGISNLDTLVKFSAIGIDGNGNNFAIPYIWSSSVFTTMLVLSNATLRIVASNMGAADAYFILEYTKTT